jgi:hypothetical protein
MFYMLAALLILSLAVCAPFGLYALGKSEERHKLRMQGIAVAPMPPLPMQFKWRGWVVGLRVFLWLILVLPCAAIPYASNDNQMWPFFLLYAAIPIVVGFNVLSQIRWYFSGPAIVLSLDGLCHAGKSFSWSEISSIRCTTNGKGGRLVIFELTGRKFWHGLILRSSIKIPALCIIDSDELFGYSSRLLASRSGITGLS